MGLITYPSGRTGEPKASQGLLWYAKASLTPDTSARLSAYKEQHAIFPSDPTTDQWFDTEKFECYGLLGQHTARHLTTLRINAARSANHNPNLVPGYAPTEDERRVIDEKFNDDTRAWLADHIQGSTAASPAN